MSKYIPIHEVASQYNLTSRTLRYWEQKGLFSSSRDSQSNWRVFDDEAIECIRLVILLREMDIAIKYIKEIICSNKTSTVAKVFEMQLKKFQHEDNEIKKKINLINRCLGAANSICHVSEDNDFIKEITRILADQIDSEQALKSEWEECIMENKPILTGALRIISLPAMRLAVCNVISQSPEDEALSNILNWAEEENLMGTARIFGFNTTLYSPGCPEYGWAASITIPEQIKLPEYLEEKRIPGGLYASFNSTNEVYDSWQVLMKLLKECKEYEVDKGRQCLEEHILSGECEVQGKDFYLTLLEPIKIK